MDRANDLAIHNELNLINPLRAHDFAFYGETLLVFGSNKTLEAVTGIFAIDSGEQHRTGGDKTAPCFQAVDPRLVTEAARQVYIDAAETQRHRMHSVGCPGGRAQTETAIQQRVVGQESVKGPFPLVIAAPSDLHPSWRGNRPVRDRKLSLPVV